MSWRLRANIERSALLTLGWSVLAVTSGVHAEKGKLAGRVSAWNSRTGVKRVTVRAFAHGRSVARETQSEGNGAYLLEDLEIGQYAVCVAAGETYRPVSVPAVQVRNDATTTLDLQLRYSLMIEGDSWLQSHRAFAQSFQASGLGLTMVGVKAFGPARRVRVQALNGDGLQGEPIGPPRTTEPVGGEGSAFVWWSGSEVPTVPGQRYTLEMAAPNGQDWVSGVAGRGDVYPLGSAYFDESPRPLSDLGIALCEDNDSLRTNYAVAGDDRAYRATSTGQTFVALSRNISFASAALAGVMGPPVYARFSIHEGSPGGRQIGPSKGTAVTADAAVAWGPAEVPVTPGQTYYLHVESFNGAKFLIATQQDSYAAGHAVFDGRPAPERDICAMVAGQLSDKDFARLVAHRRHLTIILLVNPSFEDGSEGWHRDGDAGTVVGCDEGVVPLWGTKMFGWTNKRKGEGSRPIIYQQIQAKEGCDYAFSASIYTDHKGGRSSDVKIRLLVLPAGGTAVRDNDRIETSQWYATEGQWRRGSVEFRARADTITLGVELEQRFNLETSSLYVDGAYLERIGAK